MDDAKQARARLREDLRVLSQEIAALGVDPLPSALLEEMAGVTLLHAAGIVNTVRVPLVVLDATLHVLMANRYFYECFQVTPQETGAHRLYDLGNGQWDIPGLRHLLEQIVPHHTAFDDFEVTHTFPHLGPKTMLLNARQIVRTHGAPPLILLAIEDITARRRDEAAGHQQREVLALTLGSIADAVLTTDTEGRITFLNPVAEALTGWSLQDALGQPCEVVFRLVHERTRQPLESPVARVLRDGLIGDLAPQTVLITRDGRDVPVADLSAPIRRGAEELYGVVVVFRDASDLRQLEAQLRHAQKMEALGTLSAGIAHDFNNILAAIIGYTELVQIDTKVDNPHWGLLQRVLTASLRAKALVQQILAFSRSTPVTWTPVSLAAVLRETLPFLRALLPPTIALEDHLTPETTLVLANATQIQQIIMNLGANARDAMDATGGRLAIHLEVVEVDAASHPALHAGPYVRLSVRDSGPGIPPDVLARIFEPFFTTKEVGQGTGLGLSVVHGIVESHNGALLVESPPGQGTTFMLYLPRLVGRLDGDTPPAADDSPRPTV
jgi:PAS domain S-box-containing protein